MPQVVTKLSALKAWDKDGRLDKMAREAVAPPPATPSSGKFDAFVRDAVRTGGKAGAVRLAHAMHTHSFAVGFSQAAPDLRALARPTAGGVDCRR